MFLISKSSKKLSCFLVFYVVHSQKSEMNEEEATWLHSMHSWGVMVW